MNLKGQGALEYLLMIGAGIAIAAIVLIFVLQSGEQQKCNNFKQSVMSMCNQRGSQSLCTSNKTVINGQLGSNDQCTWDTASSMCIVDETNVDWSDNTQNACPNG